jgi:hypothetical protein
VGGSGCVVGVGEEREEVVGVLGVLGLRFKVCLVFFVLAAG